MATKIQVWKCKDGTFHEVEDEAKRHDSICLMDDLLNLLNEKEEDRTTGAYLTLAEQLIDSGQVQIYPPKDA